MTERGLPIVDGAPACPFVAFDDDRDERATSPDHRHRCYAENPPAPRALAHQEAYCLSSAFPVCPTFQDWARREAAHARAGSAAAGEDEDDLPPIVVDRPPRRPGQQTWSAPPPWLRGGQPVPGAGPGPDAGPPAAGATPPPAGGAPGGAGGLAGSYADRMVSGEDARGPAVPGEWDDAAAWDAEEAAAAADLAAGGGAAAGAAAAGAYAANQMAYRGAPPSPGGLPSDPGAMEEAGPPRRRGHERVDAGREDPPGYDAYAPAWERPRRLEAYPTLRSRRLSGAFLSPLLLAVVVVLLVGAAFFFLPSLLGLGGRGGGSSPAPSAGSSVAPSFSLAPTAVPEATPTIYLVQPGDTMSRIAKKFNVPLADLIAANHDTIPNPDVLKIGDTVIIPTPQPSELPAAS